MEKCTKCILALVLQLLSTTWSAEQYLEAFFDFCSVFGAI
jgi:hypothetical protein